ncbi:hypothetical protein AB0J35_45905 [Nonomuraea angiospora]|uniref:hypothetical protein n=1 Tax=Nonomuraea angiospora TaxID=46172 RepID=UPI003415750E
MADIGYFDAWQLWLQGRPTTGYDLLGVPMLWWGRTGKILSFVAGTVVVIDLVGVEKLSRYGERLVRFMAARITVRPFIVGLVSGMIAAAFTGVVTGPMGEDSQLRYWIVRAVGSVSGGLTSVIGYALQHPKFAPAARWVSLGLFLIGFHFDLLAS